MASLRRTTVVGLALVAVLGGAIGLRLRAQDGAEEEGAPEPAAALLWEEPGRCQACHSETDWSKILEPDEEQFDHAATGFPLRAAHAEVTCDGCHRRGLEGLTTACAACHHDPHGGFRTKSCEECHDERSWEVPRNFAFHERTRFPLTGVHASLACERCHRQRAGEFANETPTECIVCHAPHFRAAQPDHLVAGFTECAGCHSTSTFRGATYIHQSYALLGQHVVTRCAECHTGAVFSGLANGGSDCSACHIDDYGSTVALSQASNGGVPDHPAGNFPLTCTTVGCHPDSESTGTWDTDGMPGQ